MVGLVILGIVALGVGVVLFSNKGEGLHFILAAKSLFIQDLSKTPKGAEIAYSKAIEEDRERYQLASDTYAVLSGQLIEVKAQHDAAMRRVERIEGKMDRLARSGDAEGLRVLSRERSGLLVEIESYRSQGEKLAPAAQEAQSIMGECEAILKQRERDKQIKVSEYRLTDSMKKTYAALDQLRADTNTGKLLKSVEEGLHVNKQQAVGAQMVHANKSSTQAARLEARMAHDESDEYVEALMDKYQNENRGGLQ